MIEIGYNLEISVIGLIFIAIGLFLFFEIGKDRISKGVLFFLILLVLVGFFLFSFSVNFLIQAESLGKPIPVEKLSEEKEMEIIFSGIGFSLVFVQENNFLDLRFVKDLPPMKNGQKFFIRDKKVIKIDLDFKNREPKINI